MKCLFNDNVRHNGNDVNDPEYDKYQIIQSKNDYSCTQLTAMGYDTDLLKTGYDEAQIKAAAEDFTHSVTVVANTRERQEALVKATTHGKKFFVTGGKHINSHDMFISAEMGNLGRGKSRRWRRVKRCILNFTRGTMRLLLCLSSISAVCQQQRR
jgi:hypothetical protein